ncbi:hypothetical protein evm_014203 [Chilo suppressalis]|nr:hypothetical protein evm_014203 [Chilo suppressalis]
MNDLVTFLVRILCRATLTNKDDGLTLIKKLKSELNLDIVSDRAMGTTRSEGGIGFTEADKCSESLRQLELGGGEELERMLRVLGLNMQESVLSGGVHVVRIDAQPPLAFAGNDPELPRAAALRYLRRALAQKPPSSASTTSSTTG